MFSSLNCLSSNFSTELVSSIDMGLIVEVSRVQHYSLISNKVLVVDIDETQLPGEVSCWPVSFMGKFVEYVSSFQAVPHVYVMSAEMEISTLTWSFVGGGTSHSPRFFVANEGTRAMGSCSTPVRVCTLGRECIFE